MKTLRLEKTTEVIEFDGDYVNSTLASFVETFPFKRYASKDINFEFDFEEDRDVEMELYAFISIYEHLAELMDKYPTRANRVEILNKLNWAGRIQCPIT